MGNLFNVEVRNGQIFMPKTKKNYLTVEEAQNLVDVLTAALGELKKAPAPAAPAAPATGDQAGEGEAETS
jgi:hypothetical protein